MKFSTFATQSSAANLDFDFSRANSFAISFGAAERNNIEKKLSSYLLRKTPAACRNSYLNQANSFAISFGAAEKTRTSTGVTPQRDCR